MRATSRSALAAVVRAGGVERRDEAASFYRQFIADYDGKTGGSGVQKSLLAEARAALNQIERRGLGKPAPDIAGDDLDGRPVQLSDHRGQVVLLVFWASWCGPCLKDVPHERELVEKFKGRPFALFGVNADDNKEEAIKAVTRAKMPWPSLADGLHGRKAAKTWVVAGLPTVIVIDHEGVIRHDSLRGKRLDAPLEALVKQAEAAKGK